MRLADEIGMTMDRPLVRVGALVACTAGLLAVYFGVARPWFRRWGATDAEVRMSLPGDEIVPAARARETRAITIAAPAEQVWPWLTQIGQDRGGFYSYKRLEDLFGCEMPEVRALVPAMQHWKLGDKLWMYPPGKVGGIGFAVLEAYVPGRALAFAKRPMGTRATRPADGSWAFVVHPIDARSSRLLFRGRAVGELRPMVAAFNVAVFEPVHFAMERRTMAGIKALAEGRSPSVLRDDIQVGLWAILFAGFLVSGAMVLAGRSVGRHLVTFVGCGLLFQFLTLVQPSPILGAILVAATIRPGALAASYRRLAWHAS
jgi:hypothetical protein